MLRLKPAIVALALGSMTALGGPAVAGKIQHETTDIILAAVEQAAETVTEADRVELVSTSSDVREMKTTNAVAVAAPAPAALALFGIGLLGLAAARRLRRR